MGSNKTRHNIATKKQYGILQKKISSNKEIWALCAPPKLPSFYQGEDVGEARRRFVAFGRVRPSLRILLLYRMEDILGTLLSASPRQIMQQFKLKPHTLPGYPVSQSQCKLYTGI